MNNNKRTTVKKDTPGTKQKTVNLLHQCMVGVGEWEFLMPTMYVNLCLFVRYLIVSWSVWCRQTEQIHPINDYEQGVIYNKGLRHLKQDIGRIKVSKFNRCSCCLTLQVSKFAKCFLGWLWSTIGNWHSGFAHAHNCPRLDSFGNRCLCSLLVLAPDQYSHRLDTSHSTKWRMLLTELIPPTPPAHFCEALTHVCA